MIRRHLRRSVELLLSQFPAVAILGPRQCGKTTLAHLIGEGRPTVYLDLEAASDRAKLSEPELYLRRQTGKLVILDEIQHAPDLFRTLRGLIDEARRRGQRAGQFLILGSASIELLQQSSETLAGRIAFAELGPLGVREVGAQDLEALWVRGGFPDSFLAIDDDASLTWRRNFIRTYLERDIPQLGPAPTRRDPKTLLDDARASSRRTFERGAACRRTGRRRQNGRTLSRPTCRSPACAPPGTVVPQRRQAPGSVAKSLPARRRHSSCSPRHRRQRRAARPSDRRHVLGRLRHREHFATHCRTPGRRATTGPRPRRRSTLSWRAQQVRGSTQLK